MVGNTYLHSVAGVFTEVAATQVSTGAADANKIVALNASGLLDSSLIPSGSGGGVPGGTTGNRFTAPVTADLAVGDLAYITSSGALAPAQADAIDHVAQGFIAVAGTLSPAVSATIQFEGLVSGPEIVGLTPGAELYLDAAASKKFTTTAPSAIGSVVQPLGFAVSPTQVFFDRQRHSVN